MRFLLILFLLASITSSCVIYDAYPAQQETLTKIPFAPQEGSVDVFFLSESKPSRDYIRIAMVEETSKIRGTQSSELLEGLREKSQRLGADALLVLDNEAGEIIQTDLVAEDTYSIPNNRMTGLAIRYVDNIAFSEEQLSHAVVTTQGMIAVEEGGTFYFTATGEVKGQVTGKWPIYAYSFSLQHLLHTTRGWEHSTVPAESGESLYRREIRKGSLYNNLRTTAYRNGQYGDIKITALNGLSRSVKIELEYNTEGQLVKRSWRDPVLMAKLNGEFEVRSVYHENGRLEQEQYFRKPISGGEFEPFIQVDYHYYDASNWQDLLEEEQVVRVNK